MLPKILSRRLADVGLEPGDVLLGESPDRIRGSGRAWGALNDRNRLDGHPIAGRVARLSHRHAQEDRRPRAERE